MGSRGHVSSRFSRTGSILFSRLHDLPALSLSLSRSFLVLFVRCEIISDRETVATPLAAYFRPITGDRLPANIDRLNSTNSPGFNREANRANVNRSRRETAAAACLSSEHSFCTCTGQVCTYTPGFLSFN